MASDSGDDAAALRERVAQLEETVAEQQATSESPEQPSASRRGFVKAAAAVAGLGALGIYSSYPASAQAAGQVGSASNPIDVKAWNLTVQNQLAGDLDAGGNSLANVGAVETERVNITHHVKTESELIDAINSVSQGDIIEGDLNSQITTSQAHAVTTPHVTIKQLNLKLGAGVEDNPLQINADYVTVEKCFIDGNKANNTDDGNNGTPIEVSGANHVTVKGCVAVDSSRHGFHATDAVGEVTDLTFKKCLAIDPYRDGIASEVVTGNVTGGEDVTVSDCTVLGSETRGGIEINEYFKGVTIENCRVYPSSNTTPSYLVALEDHGTGVPPEAVTITDCHAKNIDRFIKANQGGSEITIDSNVFRNQTSGGNPINCVGHDSLTITNNDLVNMGHNLKAEGCVNTTIGSNTIDGVTNANNGVLVRDCDTVLMFENVVTGAENHGVVIEVTDGATHSRFSVIGNQIIDNDDLGIFLFEGSGTLDEYMVSLNISLGNNDANLSDSGTGSTKLVTNNLT